MMLGPDPELSELELTSCFERKLAACGFLVENLIVDDILDLLKFRKKKSIF